MEALGAGGFWYEPGWELPTGLENDNAKFARFLAMQVLHPIFCPYYYAGGFDHLAQDIPNELINVPLENYLQRLGWLKVQPM